MPRLFLMFIACTGCRSCGAPVATNQDSQALDSATDTVDTAETAETADTAPPPMCAQIEVEPNDQRTEATEIALTSWACGTFYDPEENDWDHVTFDLVRGDAAGATWVEIDVDASNRASIADPEVIVYGPDHEPFLIEDFDRNTDPYVVFPVSEDGTWDLALYDKYAGSGEDYGWFLRAIVGKQPLNWDAEEVEPNDSLSDDLVEVTDGSRVFGTVSETYDLDWFVFLPQAGQPNLTLSLLANNFGSPLDGRLAIYDSVGSKLEAATQGIGDSYDKDPVVSVPLDSAETYYISVRIETDEGTQTGGYAFWYVLDVEVTDEDISG